MLPALLAFVAIVLALAVIVIGPRYVRWLVVGTVAAPFRRRGR